MSIQEVSMACHWDVKTGHPADYKYTELYAISVCRMVTLNTSPCRFTAMHYKRYVMEKFRKGSVKRFP